MAPLAFWTAVAVGVGAVAVAAAGSGGTLPVGAYVVADKMAAAAAAVLAAAARVSLPRGLRPPPSPPPPSPPRKPAAAPDAAYVAALTAPLVAPRGVEPPLLPAVSVVVVVRAAGGDGQAAAPPTSSITTYHAGVGSPTDDTRYELGSITKVFASLLLARAVAAGRVRLDTPVAHLLPAAALPLPPPHWPRVTLQQLATHTAGLPREPPGGEAAAAASAAAPPPGDALPPVAQPRAIPVAAWTAGLRGVSFRTPPGTRWAYSNFGAGLLGHVVARAVGAPSFAAAVREWVFVPAGMAAAAVADGGGLGDGAGAPEAGGSGEVATPHDGGGAVPPSAYTDATAAAGGARASVADMGAFGAFCLAAAADGRPQAAAPAAAAGGAASATAEAEATGQPHGGATPTDAAALAAAVRVTLPTQTLSATGRPITFASGQGRQALGWMSWYGGTVQGHNGCVAGSASFLFLDARAGVAVAVLASAAEERVVNDLGVAVFKAARGQSRSGGDGAIAMPPPPAALPPGALDAVAGTYRFIGQEAVLSVARPGGGRAEQLWVAVLGARRRLFPVDATARAFDVRPEGLRVRFVGLPPVAGVETRGAGGAGAQAKPALWVSGGGLPFSLRCRRVEAAEEEGWWGRLEGAVGGLVWRWAGQ